LGAVEYFTSIANEGSGRAKQYQGEGMFKKVRLQRERREERQDCEPEGQGKGRPAYAKPLRQTWNAAGLP